MDEIKRIQLAADLSEESGEKAGEIPDAATVATSCNSWGVKAQLKFHQAEGVVWLIRRYARGVNVILGETCWLTSSAQLSQGKLECRWDWARRCSRLHLILSPLSVTDGWASELKRFAPELRVMRYVGDKQYRQSMRETICEHVNKQPLECRADPTLPFDVLLTTYELAVLDAKFLSRFCWRYCVIDEAQRLKNSATVLYRTLMEKYMVPRRLLLTGTPVQNNLSELWALLHFCMPKIFWGRKEFLDSFGPAAAATQATSDEESPDGYDAKTSRQELRLLRRVLRAFMLRRTKAALVESKVLSLPPLAEVTVFAPLLPIQKEVYISVLKKEAPNIVGKKSRSTSGRPLQNIIMQLRKVCSHPYLFDGVEPEPFEEGEHVVEASGKLFMLDIVLKRLHAEGHRVLIFAQMTRTLDIIQDYLQYRGYTYDRLDGSLRAEERFAAVRSFSPTSSTGGTSSCSSPFVFLLTTRAGGVGLNLVAADTVIFYEQDWNPQADKQALQRAHRMGQSRSVLVINLITQNTVEEVILQRARTKLQLTHEVIGRDDADLEKHGPASYHDSEMEAMIVFGLKKIVFDAKVASERHESSFEKGTDLREMETIIDDALKQRLALDDPFVKNGESLKSLSVLEDLSRNRLLKFSQHVHTQEALAALKSIDSINHEAGQRVAIAGKRSRKRPAAEADSEAVSKKKSKAIESKLGKWASIGYKSLNLSEPDDETDTAMREGGEEQDADYIHYMVGDCSKPTLTTTEAAIILWCVDDSGDWGSGGVFDALARLSKSIPEAYEAAYSAGDLHLGDVHLVQVPDTDENEERASERNENTSRIWVALCVMQSYDGRRKIPRSDISPPHFESCLQKVSVGAGRRSASIHMPRIQVDSSSKQGWYVVERLLRKYATAFRVHFNVYYFK